MTFTETICNINCQRSCCFIGTRRKFLHEHDLRCTTSTTEEHFILAASSGIVWIGNSPNRWIGRGTAQNWPPRPSNLNSKITLCGVTRKLWRTDARRTRNKNCFYPILNATRSVNNVRLYVHWLYATENVSRQMKVALNNLRYSTT